VAKEVSGPERDTPDLEARIAARRADSAFATRLSESMDVNGRALERLADDEDAAYARLAAAQDDEDREYHELMRGRRRDGEEPADATEA
jgi:hypothetical protein